MTTVTLNAGTTSCPAVYLNLRNEIVNLIDLRQKGVKIKIRELVRSRFPKLSSKVIGHRLALDTMTLYKILDIPMSSSCLHCGKPTRFNRLTMNSREFCSIQCLSSSKITHERRSVTSESKIGFSHWRKDPARQQEMVDKCLEETGYDNWRKVPESEKKSKETYFAKTGYYNPGKNPEVRKKAAETLFRKTGHWHPSQVKGFAAACRKTYFGRTGYYHPLQNPEVFARVQRKQLKLKKFVAKDGRVYRCRGYEPQVLKFLENNPLVKKFTTTVNTRLLPAVPYQRASGKTHVYYPDIGVELFDGRKLIIEVKSVYTLFDKEDINRRKFKAAVQLCKTIENTNFWLAIYHPKTKTITWHQKRVEL